MGGEKMVKAELVKIASLKLELELYPRMKTGWLTAFQYAQAMKAGSIFPSIIVGKLQNKLYVVDGWHRIEARKLLGEEYIEATIRDFKDKREMFAEAVRVNSVHGRRLSVQEMVRIVHKLEEMHFKPKEISEIVKVPIDKISMFQDRAITGPNGKPVFLKGISAKAGVSEAVNQGLFNVSSVANLLEQLVMVLENEMLSLEDEAVKELAIEVYSLLGKKLELVAEL